MCGIAGIFGGRLAAADIGAVLSAMNQAQVHRGPDDEGTVIDESLGAGLGSRRLSIVDIERGHQPAANEDGTIHAVLNGEIYNHEALREWLRPRGHSFHSRSDTEVLVHLYEELGDALLERLEGMFALAILDARGRRLLLARDGPGMKPLYTAETPHGFVFASEVKALLASGLVRAEPDLEALDAYLAAGYVHAPLSMFRGVRKLRAGRYLVVEPGRVREGTFWKLRHQAPGVARSIDDYAAELEALLRRAVRSHLAADVPVGAFLSGGWDSSLTTMLAAEASPATLKTFSIVFPENPAQDESRFSRMLAGRLGTDHHEIEFRAAQMPGLMPSLIRHLEEPVSTAPAALFYVLCSLVSRHVKTAISGEGADELFGGYEWYRIDAPYAIRRLAPPWVFRKLAPMCPHARARKALRILGAVSDRRADAEWRRALDAGGKRELLKPEFRTDGPDLEPVLLAGDVLESCSDSLQRRLAFDFTARLADGILFLGDKTGMAHSLETRMPFLDRSVVEFAMRLPSRFKVHRGREKRVVGEVARRLLPPEIAARRKQGLGYPPTMWREKAAFNYARELLLDSRRGPFRRAAVEKALAAGAPPMLRPLNLLVFLQCWWNEFIG